MLLTSIPLYDPGNLDERTPAGTRRLLTPSNKRYSMAPSLEDVGEANSDKTIASGKSSRSSGSNPNVEKTLLSGGGFHELPTIQRPDSEDIDRDRLRQAAEERRRKKQQQNPLHKAFKDTTLLALLDECFSKNEPEYDKLKVDVDKADDRVLVRSTAKYDAGEMLDDLRRVTAPIVAVHGNDDPVLDAPDTAVWDYLTVEKEDVFVPILLPDVRHFPMLEHNAYPRLVGDFLSTADLSTLEVRERWRRRSR
jgi:pimeloyl-ACP methyl ester carboxylesterase